MVTIGQAPRVDVTPELAELLGPEVRVIEQGALDECSADQIAELVPRPDAEGVLTSRLRDGTFAVFTHAAVQPFLAAAIDRGEQAGADATLVICSAHFADLPHRRPLFALEPLAHAGVREMLEERGDTRLGIVVPIPEQLADGPRRWGASGLGVTAAAVASPYSQSPAATAAAAASIAPECDLIVLDCAGYGRAHEQAARQACAESGFPVPVVAARTVGVRQLRMRRLTQ